VSLLPPGPKTKPVKRTEREMISMLRQRHVKAGNGGSGEYAFLAHVRNEAGFNATRTFDAVTVSLWPSRGLEIHAFEIKCSRSDWLRELKNPAKAEAAAKVCDRFWMVVSDDTIILDGELPVTWGLLVARGSKLVSVKQAPLLPGVKPTRPVTRSFLVALLRAAGAVPEADSQEVREARNVGYEQGLQHGKDALEAEKAVSAELRNKIRAFENETHIQLGGRWPGHDPAEVGRAVRSILDGEDRAKDAHRHIANTQATLRRAADELDKYLPREARADA
jgi:hypothetical protein